MYQLILGGARSGKSRLAEKLAAESGLAVIYIATSQPLDGEMNERVTLHRQRRPDHWGLVEEPIELTRVLRENAATDRCLLVDCLTLWLTNLLMLEDPARLGQESRAGLGQRNLARGPLQKLDAEAILQLADAVAQRGL